MKTAALALVLLALLAPPQLGTPNYFLAVAVTAMVYTVCASGLNVVYGLMGLLSLAHVGFWGIGGYVAAISVVDHGLPHLAGVLIAGATGAVLSLLLGVPALRLNRHSFVIVTLTFTLLSFLVSRDWVSVTRGPLGIPGLPLPEVFGFQSTSVRDTYYIVLGFTLISLAALYAFFTSRIATTMRAINHSENLARSQGVATARFKLLSFAISAFFAGATGGIYVFHVRIVDPLIFDLFFLQVFLVMVIAGGRGSFWGVVAASVVMSILPEVLRFSTDLRMVMYGAVLLAVVIFAPEGFAGLARRWRPGRVRRQERST